MSTLLQRDREATEALSLAQAPHLIRLAAQVQAGIDVVEAATRREATQARQARRRLREGLRSDARFLLDEAQYQTFRSELMSRDRPHKRPTPAALERLRAPDFIVAFDGHHRSIEEDYNDEEHYLTRVLGTRVTVGAHHGDVSVVLARRFVRDPTFIPEHLGLDTVPYNLEELVGRALGRPSSNPFDPSREKWDYNFEAAVSREVAALMLFALPLLRPARVRARLP